MPKGDLYIGLMSGTSMDAVDTALVQFENDKPNLIAYQQFPIEDTVRTAVRAINANSTLAEITKYDAILGNLFAESAQKILKDATIEGTTITATEIAAIGSHGQTVLHLPDDAYPRSVQIGDPNIIAAKTGITTIADFRRMDIAAGGQGAPLAPAFHNRVFRKQGTNRLILNLGGIANITLLPGDLTAEISGFDTGPGNGLLDDWNKLHNGTDMDKDGQWAASGELNQSLLSAMLEDPYFKLPPAKSTGRDYFNLNWLENCLSSEPNALPTEDVQATLLSLTVESIATTVQTHAAETSEIYVCGGGAHNALMMQQLKEKLPKQKIETTQVLDLNPDAVEAVTFAWLAKQTLNKQTGNQPSVTGASTKTLLGGVYQAE